MELALAGRLIAACVVVALVLVALQVVARTSLRARATATPGGRLIAVLETTLLPNAASLHVVRVAEKYYVIGRSGAHIAALGEIAPESVVATAATTGSAEHLAAPLAAWLARVRNPRA